MSPAVQRILEDIQVVDDFLPSWFSPLRQKLSEECVQAFKDWNLKQKNKHITNKMGRGEHTLHCGRIQFT